VEEDALMFFVLSKTAALLLVPSNLLLLVGFLGLVLLLARRRRLGRILCVTSLALFVAIAVLPVGAAMNFVLENRFPAWDPARGAPDGIVVLGGAINARLSRSRGAVVLSDAAERLTVMAKLARDYPAAKIVFSSGDASLRGDGPAEADFVLPLLDALGVPRGRVLLENKARNTAENAIFTKALVDPKPGERWLLVTSAQHMPRAVGAFRHAGFPVEAYPVDWHSFPRWRLRVPTDLATVLATTDSAAHEWEGLIAYRLTGRIDRLFPGP
jgi:uncharacterized SAM-binding protein YcdF (DUF218 family)